MLKTKVESVLSWVALRRVAALVAALALPVMFAGCHTVHGAGKDIESAGEGIQDAAD